MVDGEDHGGAARRVGVAQQRGVGTAEAEDRGVGVAGEHPVGRGDPEGADELELLGVHVLCVVDDEVAHRLALRVEQRRVRGERVEHGGDSSAASSGGAEASGLARPAAARSSVTSS